MWLQAYLDETKQSYTDFAEKIGVSHARTVQRIAKGEVPAGTKLTDKIVTGSEGRVTATDLYECWKAHQRATAA